MFRKRFAMEKRRGGYCSQFVDQKCPFTGAGNLDDPTLDPEDASAAANAAVSNTIVHADIAPVILLEVSRNP